MIAWDCLHVQMLYLSIVEETWQWLVKGPPLVSLPPIQHHTSLWCLDSLTRYKSLSLCVQPLHRYTILHSSIAALYMLCVTSRCLARPCCCCAWWLCPTRGTSRPQQVASRPRWDSWCCSSAFPWAATAATPSTPTETSHPGSSVP